MQQNEEEDQGGIETPVLYPNPNDPRRENTQKIKRICKNLKKIEKKLSLINCTNGLLVNDPILMEELNQSFSGKIKKAFQGCHNKITNLINDLTNNISFTEDDTLDYNSISITNEELKRRIEEGEEGVKNLPKRKLLNKLKKLIENHSTQDYDKYDYTSMIRNCDYDNFYHIHKMHKADDKRIKKDKSKHNNLEHIKRLLCTIEEFKKCYTGAELTTEKQQKSQKSTNEVSNKSKKITKQNKSKFTKQQNKKNKLTELEENEKTDNEEKKIPNGSSIQI